MLKTDINENPISKVYDGKKGYTLLELIAVMAIFAILASLSVPRFIDLDASSGQKALRAAVEELDSRERMV
jgi:prepilin-type N-terminal cleavage/methylation domain-containing protein